MSVERRGTPPDVRGVIHRGYAVRRRRRVVRASPIVGGALVVALVVANLQTPQNPSRLVTKPGPSPVVTSTVPGPPTVGDGPAGVPGLNRPIASTRRRVVPAQPVAPMKRTAPVVVFERVLAGAPGGHAEIVRLDPGATEPRVLVDSDALINAVQPALSPDGLTVAYATTRNSLMNGVRSVFDIWLMDLNGGNQRRLTRSNPVQDGSGAGFPGWSPDGRRLAYSFHDGAVGRLYTMNADGTEQHVIAGTEDGFSPVWSPDGLRIGFLRNPGPFTAWIADLRSGAVDQLAVPQPDLGVGAAAWSGDGRRLALLRGPRVVLHDLATHEETIVPFQGAPQAVVFCGQADQLLVRVTIPGATELVLVGTDGSRPTRILGDAGIAPGGPISCRPYGRG